VTSSAEIIWRRKRRTVGVVMAAVAFALLVGARPVSTAPVRRPTAAEVGAQTRKAVIASRARLVDLRVVAPTRAYWLTVKVPDPAAYLKRRVAVVVQVMNRLTNVQWRFRSRRFTVVNHSGSRVLWLKELREEGRETTRFYVRPGLEDCVRNIDFEVEVDPDRVAPPCPAR
jgi:hypothetical protein